MHKISTILGMSMVKIIAEVGCNHQGNLDTALKMKEAAFNAGEDYVKFQKRNPDTFLTPDQYNAPYDSPHSFGSTYGLHR